MNASDRSATSAEAPEAASTPVSWQFPYALRALRHRNFCLFFAGQFVSRTGYWMQNMAQSWLVYRLSQSSFMLGLVGFAGQFPTLFLGLFAGVVADRFNRYHVILLTLVLAMLQALTLGVLTLAEWVTVWQIFFLAIFAGAVQTFEMPARQSFLTEIVGREDLSSAVALNSALVNGARIIGPALAGALVAQAGEAVCFLINAISYLAIIGGFLAMRLPAKSTVVANQVSLVAFMREGVAYAVRTPAIRLLLVLIGLASFLSTPYTVLMPIFAGDILHGGPSGMGMLMGAAGAGAVVGVMFLARHHTPEKIAGTIVFALVRFGIGLILFAFSRHFWLSMLLLPLVGSGFMLPMSAANTLLQTLTPDHLRGRVMSLFFIVFMSTPPVGSLLAGFLAPLIGAPLTVAGTGVLCLAGAAWFALKVHLLREAAEEEKRGETAL